MQAVRWRAQMVCVSVCVWYKMVEEMCVIQGFSSFWLKLTEWSCWSSVRYILCLRPSSPASLVCPDVLIEGFNLLTRCEDFCKCVCVCVHYNLSDCSNRCTALHRTSFISLTQSVALWTQHHARYTSDRRHGSQTLQQPVTCRDPCWSMPHLIPPQIPLSYKNKHTRCLSCDLLWLCCLFLHNFVSNWEKKRDIRENVVA